MDSGEGPVSRDTSLAPPSGPRSSPRVRSLSTSRERQSRRRRRQKNKHQEQVRNTGSKDATHPTTFTEEVR